MCRPSRDSPVYDQQHYAGPANCTLKLHIYWISFRNLHLFTVLQAKTIRHKNQIFAISAHHLTLCDS